MDDTQRAISMVETAIKNLGKIDSGFARKERSFQVALQGLQHDLVELVDEYKYADSLIYGLELFAELYPHARGGMYPDYDLSKLKEEQSARLERLQIVLKTRIPGLDKPLIRQH